MKNALAAVLSGLLVWCLAGCESEETPIVNPIFDDTVRTIELRTSDWFPNFPPVLSTTMVAIPLIAIAINQASVGVPSVLIQWEADFPTGLFEPSDSTITDSTGEASVEYNVQVPLDTTRILLTVRCGEVLVQRTLVLIGQPEAPNWIELRLTHSRIVGDVGSQGEIGVFAIARDQSGISIPGLWLVFSETPEIGNFNPDSCRTDDNGLAISWYQVTIPPDTTQVIISASRGQVQSQKTVTLIGR